MKLFRLAAALVIALGSSATALAQSPTVLKMGYALSPESHYGVGAKAFADKLTELTNGRYQIQHFPNGALGGEREMIEQVQLGTLDLVSVSTGAVSNFVPETGITDIPFLFKSPEHARAVLDGPIGADILAKFPARGLIALGWGEQGFRDLTNNKRQVATPEDLKGLKIRTMENPVHIEAFKVLGALPTPMAWPEVIPALQQHTIDGQENPISVIVSAKLSQVQKYLSLTRHVYSPTIFMMAPKDWSGLSDADKKAFLGAAEAGKVAMRKYVDDVEQKGVAELRKQGMQVDTEIDASKFQAQLGPAYAQYAKKFGQANIDKIRNFKY